MKYSKQLKLQKMQCNAMQWYIVAHIAAYFWSRCIPTIILGANSLQRKYNISSFVKFKLSPFVLSHSLTSLLHTISSYIFRIRSIEHKEIVWNGKCYEEQCYEWFYIIQCYIYTILHKRRNISVSRKTK